MNTLSKYLNFNFLWTRLSRTQYFSYVGISLAIWIFSDFLNAIPLNSISYRGNESTGVVLNSISELITTTLILANITFLIRRLHDLDISGKWLLLVLLAFIPLGIIYVFNLENVNLLLAVLGSLAMLILSGMICFIVTLRPGSPSANRFGEAP